MTGEHSSRRIQSVETAFTILTLIQQHGSVSLQDLAKQLDVAKSTVHTHLQTLASLGYIVEQDGQYRLGLRLLTHGMAAREAISTKQPIQSVFRELENQISAPVWWLIAENGRGIFIDHTTADPDEYGRIGKRSYLHTTAPGKAMLALYDDATIRTLVAEQGLPVHTTRTITDVEELLAEIQSIRETGYARSRGEAAIGVHSVGVGFKTPAGQVHGFGVFWQSYTAIKHSDHDRLVDQLLTAREQLYETFHD